MIAPVIDIASARQSGKHATNPADLLHRLRIEGLHLRVQDGILFAGPKADMTAWQRKLIRDHRDALIWAMEREEYLAALDQKEFELDCVWKQHESLRKQYEDSEEKRKRAENLLELTRIQLDLERQWGGVWRSKPDLPPIPEDIRRFIASRCHPDHNQDSDIATKAMAWLNGQPREERQ